MTNILIRPLVFVLALSVLVTAHPRASELEGRLAGGLWSHEVVRGDTLRSIGSRYGVDPQTLAADNNLRVNATLSIGRTLRIDNRHIVPSAARPGLVVINIPQRMLFYDGPAGLMAFPVAAGRRDWSTMTAKFTVLTKERNPSWDVPVSIREEARRAGRELPTVVPPGPANPLGQYWLGLSLDSLGIHGTNAPSSIYQLATHGCIRLHRDDIEQVFEAVSVGTQGETVYQPLLIALVSDVVYLEAHRDAYERLTDDSRQALRGLADAAGLTDRIDWQDVDRILTAREGIARAVKLRVSADVDGPLSNRSDPAPPQSRGETGKIRAGTRVAAVFDGRLESARR